MLALVRVHRLNIVLDMGIHGADFLYFSGIPSLQNICFECLFKSCVICKQQNFEALKQYPSYFETDFENQIRIGNNNLN